MPEFPAPTDLSRTFQFEARGRRVLDRPQGNHVVGRVTARSGHPVVTVDGRKLHSGRDPVREAQRFVDALDLEDVTFALLFGYGSGYVARALAERLPRAMIGVYEPSPEVLAEGLRHGPIPENVRIVTCEVSLQRLLHHQLHVRQKVLLAIWPPSERVCPKALAEAAAGVRRAIANAKIVHKTRVLRTNAWLDAYLANIHQLTRAAALPQLAGAFQGQTVVVVAAGPSLDKNIHELSRISGRAAILAVNSSASALAEAGIVPTALVCVESLDMSSQLAALPFIGEVPAFFDLTAHPNIWTVPAARRIAISVDNSVLSFFTERVLPGASLAGGYCVANTAVSLAARLGARRIVLVGSDLAYSDGRMYARGTSFGKIRAHLEGDVLHLEGLEEKRAIEARSGHRGPTMSPPRRPGIRVCAWGGRGTVPTTRDFAMFRDWYAWYAPRLAERGIACINATEGGARIPDWDEQPLSAVVDELQSSYGPGPNPHERLRSLARGAAVSPADLRAALEVEHRRAVDLVGHARKGLSIVGRRRQVERTLPLHKLERLKGVLAAIRAVMEESPFASMAADRPLDLLLDEETFDTGDLFRAVVGPADELRRKLARVLQSLGDAPGGNHDATAPSDTPSTSPTSDTAHAA